MAKPEEKLLQKTVRAGARAPSVTAALTAASRDFAPTSDDVMLSTDQLCALTSTGGTFWYEARLRGGGPPFVKFGRLVRYRWGDVKAWMRGNQRLSTSDDGNGDRAA